MNYLGVDIHPAVAGLQCACCSRRARRGAETGRINGNEAFGFAQFFSSLEGKSKVVVEACWNWGRIHDLLQEIDTIEEVVLAKPLKTRLIADAQIKTDGLDAKALAHVVTRRSNRPGLCTQKADAPTQGSFASATLLGPAAHSYPQSHSGVSRSATRAVDATVQRLDAEKAAQKVSNAERSLNPKPQ